MYCTRDGDKVESSACLDDWQMGPCFLKSQLSGFNLTSCALPSSVSKNPSK